MTPDEIRTVFCAPELSWIVERLRTRIEQGKGLTGTLTLQDSTPAQRSALDSLLGRRATRGNTLSLRVESLSEVTGLEDVADIVQVCCGDVPNFRARRNQLDDAWSRLFADSRERLRNDADGQQWIASLAKDGLLKRLVRSDPTVGRDLMHTALNLWERMPFERITLAELAANTTGDTHALDRGRPLSPLLLRGLKLRTGHDGNKSAQQRRMAWEAVGVVIDRISAPALTFNLRAKPGTQLSLLLDAFRSLKQPGYLTYQSLCERNPFDPLPDGMQNLFVVENPAVIEAACASLGPACAPLICTEGQPASAVKELLWRLSDAGAFIHLRADFDWPGLSFVDQLLTIPNTRLWRMDVATYHAISGTVRISGRRFERDWCAELARAMAESGCAVYEEQILPMLLEDLDHGRGISTTP